MQPVEAAGSNKARDRVGAAFDQNAAEAAGGERKDDCRGGKLAVVQTDGNALDAVGKLPGRVEGGDHEPADTVRSQHACGRR